MVYGMSQLKFITMIERPAQQHELLLQHNVAQSAVTLRSTIQVYTAIQANC